MSEKNLYNEDDTLTFNGECVTDAAIESLTSLFKRFTSLGYSPMEISHIIYSMNSNLTSDFIAKNKHEKSSRIVGKTTC